MADLNPKQRLFVDEYLVDKNGKQAAIRAGYSEKTAEQQASRLLSNVKIQAAINSGIDEQSDRIKLSADWVMARLSEVAVRCMQGEPVLDRKGNPTGEYRFDSSGANRALELIGKHFGAFPNKIKLDTEDGPLKFTLNIENGNGNGDGHA